MSSVILLNNIKNYQNFNNIGEDNKYFILN